MSTSKNKLKLKPHFIKILSLLSVIRGYNILILMIAQYLGAIFIFSPKKSIKHVLLDTHLLYIVASSIFVVAGGYIINNFYDEKADSINRPLKSSIDKYTKEETKLALYFMFNVLAVILGLLVSYRAALFFAAYIFLIWLYSHKLKKYPFTGIIAVTLLTVMPFFSIFIYYKNFSSMIFLYALFLFLVIMIRELIKNLENINGAIISNYKTFPLVYGERRTKIVALILSITSIIPITVLLKNAALGAMEIYFYVAIFTLLFVGIYVLYASSRSAYRLLHNILKILILIGVFSIIFMDPSLIIEKLITKIQTVY